MPCNSPPTQTDRTELLADPTRRRICEILTTPDPPLAVRDLAVELAAWSLDISPRAVAPEQRRNKEIQLHHHQLPKLADYGLLAYNRPSQTVRITPAGIETLTAATNKRLLSARVVAAPQCND